MISKSERHKSFKSLLLFVAVYIWCRGIFRSLPGPNLQGKV